VLFCVDSEKRKFSSLSILRAHRRKIKRLIAGRAYDRGGADGPYARTGDARSETKPRIIASVPSRVHAVISR
jgi:hypothetical protein